MGAVHWEDSGSRQRFSTGDLPLKCSSPCKCLVVKLGEDTDGWRGRCVYRRSTSISRLQQSNSRADDHSGSSGKDDCGHRRSGCTWRGKGAQWCNANSGLLHRCHSLELCPSSRRPNGERQGRRPLETCILCRALADEPFCFALDFVGPRMVDCLTLCTGHLQKPCCDFHFLGAYALWKSRSYGATRLPNGPNLHKTTNSGRSSGIGVLHRSHRLA